MSTMFDFLFLNKKLYYNEKDINNILKEYNIDIYNLLKLSLKSLNNLIFLLNQNYDEHILNIIIKNVNLIYYIFNSELYDNNELSKYNEKIIKCKYSLLSFANKYKSIELEKCANKLDNIIQNKIINNDDLNILLKELINRKEDINIISKIIDFNRDRKSINKSELFNHAFNMAYDSIVNNDRSILYYISLLKLFYNDKINSEEYIYKINKLNDINDKKVKNYIREITLLLYENKNALNKDQILMKYDLNDKLNDIKFDYPKKSITCNDKIITIDSNITSLIEDGLSIRKDGNNYIVGIHITDAGLLIKPNSYIDFQARNNLKCIYLTSGVRILPNSYENAISLNANKKKNIISLYVVLNDNGDIIDYYIKENTSKITKNYKYSYSDYIIENTNNNELERNIRDLFELSCALRDKNKIKKYYWENKAYSKSENNINHSYKSDQINSEFIILYNYLIGKICKDNNIPIIYRYQDKENISKLIEELNLDFDPLTLEKINGIYLDSKYSNEPRYHNGLGTDHYVQICAPGRKYPDLYNQQLLHKFLFKDYDFNFDIEEFDNLIEYINQRSIELKLMRREYSNYDKSNHKLERRIKKY